MGWWGWLRYRPVRPGGLRLGMVRCGIMLNPSGKNRREQLKDRCLLYCGGKRCVACGVDYLPTVCYDFHHRNNKDNEISKMIAGGYAWEEIQKELDKCVVVCKNCHAQITAGIIRV